MKRLRRSRRTPQIPKKNRAVLHTARTRCFENGSARRTKKEMQMKFMMIVKSKEGCGFPPKALMDEIDKLGQEAMKAGTMIGGGGLGPTEKGARVRLANGQVTVIDGPFTEAK